MQEFKKNLCDLQKEIKLNITLRIILIIQLNLPQKKFNNLNDKYK